MLHSLVFLGLLIACCGYAFARGGGPERIAASIFAIGSILSALLLSSWTTMYNSIEVKVFLVDFVGLLAFIALALRADRFWTLWLAALQAIETAGHAIKLLDPAIIPYGYALALAFWGYPTLLLIAVGTRRHQQRLQRFGIDRSWSSFSSPAGQQTAFPS